LFYADTIYARGKNYSDAGLSAQAVVDLAKASQLIPAEPLYHNQLAEALIQQTLTLAQENQSTEAAKFAQKAMEESELALKQNKVHLNYYKSRAKVLLTLAQIDPQFLAPAADVLEQATVLSPTDAKLFYNLGLVQLGLNQPSAALQSLEQAVELKANYESARQQLALLLENLNRTQEAKPHWQYILNHLNPNNSTAQQHLQKL
jgi:tetratricopeptide (TPR) repeat protein